MPKATNDRHNLGNVSVDKILTDQTIRIKRGRMNQYGFEPAWNSYFHFYLGVKYFSKPLLQLEDITFHLYLRKNLNDQNPAWQMPSYRTMKRQLGVSQDKIEGMMERLSRAQLLIKVSGEKKGERNANITNDYILSDPIPNLEEFLLVAESGLFGKPLLEEWQGYLKSLMNSDTEHPLPAPVADSSKNPIPEIGTGVAPILGIRGVRPIGTHKHTSNYKQTSKETDKSNTNKSTSLDVDVVVVLTNLGMSRKVAQKVAGSYSRDRIEEKIAYLEFMKTREKIKSPVGWLRRAIEEDYAKPDGFISKVEQLAFTLKEEERRQQDEAAYEALGKIQAQQDEEKSLKHEQWLAQIYAQYETTGSDLELGATLMQDLQVVKYNPLFLEAITILKFAPDKVIIGVPNTYILNQIGHPSGSIPIERSLKYLLKKSLSVEFVLLPGQ